MPLDPRRPSFYKTIRCRYFDEAGRAVAPYCKQGSHCNYIHPEDPQWEHGKIYIRKKVYPSRSLSPHSSTFPYQSEYHRNYRDTVAHSPHRGRSPERRPLTDDHSRSRAQYERPTVFEPEVREATRTVSYSNYRDREPRNASKIYREHSSDRTARDHHIPPGNHKEPVKEYERTTREHIPQPSGSQNTVRTPHPPVEQAQQKPAEQVLNDVDMVSSPQVDVPETSIHGLFDGPEVASKIAESFKTIAQITNKVILDTAAYDKEEEKLETYQNLSSTLAKVSPASVTAIAPTLAAVVQTHSKQREKVQADFQRLNRAWEEVFAVFVQGATRQIDVKTEVAIARIREEADLQISRIKASSATLERERSQNQSSHTVLKRKHEDENLKDDRQTYRSGQPYSHSSSQSLSRSNDVRYSHDRATDYKRSRNDDHSFSDTNQHRNSMPTNSITSGKAVGDNFNGKMTQTPQPNILQTQGSPTSSLQNIASSALKNSRLGAQNPTPMDTEANAAEQRPMTATGEGHNTNSN